MSRCRYPACHARRSAPASRAASASQRGNALSVGRSGTPARTEATPRPTTSDEKRLLVTATGSPEAAAASTHEIVVGRQRDRSRPENHEPAAGRRKLPQPCSERAAIGRSRHNPDVVRAKCARNLRGRAASAARAARRTAPAAPYAVGLGVEDPDGYREARGHSIRRAEEDLRARVRAYVGLGANVGDAARRSPPRCTPSRRCRAARLRGVSPLYVTAPSDVRTSPTSTTPSSRSTSRPVRARVGATALLASLKELERAAGRRRERWGPREVDLDLLLFGRARSASIAHRRRSRTIRLEPAGARPSRSRIARRGNGCSFSPRWPTLRPDSFRPAGGSAWSPPVTAARPRDRRPCGSLALVRAGWARLAGSLAAGRSAHAQVACRDLCLDDLAVEQLHAPGPCRRS